MSVTALSYEEKIDHAIYAIQQDPRLQTELDKLKAKVVDVTLAFWCCTKTSTAAMYYVTTDTLQTIRVLADYSSGIALSLFEKIGE